MKYLIQILLIALAPTTYISAQELRTVKGKLLLGEASAEVNSFVSGSVIETFSQNLKIDSTVSDSLGRFSVKASTTEKSVVKITYQNYQCIDTLMPYSPTSQLYGYVVYIREDHSLSVLRWEAPIYPAQMNAVPFRKEELRSSKVRWFADDIGKW